MSTSGGSNRLNHAIKTLRAKWDEVEDLWRDGVRRDFEKLHMEPLERQVASTMRGMNELAEVLNRARRECS
jgi:hypothetical protein